MDPSDSVRALLRKADRALDDARYLLADDRAEAAINRAYYAAFYTARAALLMEDEEPNTHAGVLNRFSYHFVHTGRISEETAQVLARAETDRNRADYDAFVTFDPETADDLLTEVRRFNAAVRRLLNTGQE